MSPYADRVIIDVVKKSISGFTIVELLIVIVVIGILAAISIVAYNGVQSRANDTAAMSAAKQVANKVALYYVANDSYPASLSEVGIVDSNDTSYQYDLGSEWTTYQWCSTSSVGKSSFYVSSSQGAPAKGGCAGHGQGGQAAVTNYMTSPSFEAGMGCFGWQNGSGYTGSITNSRSHSGSQSFMITAGNTSADRYLECNLPVSPGTYTISAKVYLTGDGTTHGNRDVMFNCASGSCSNVQSDPKYNRGSLNQWQTISRDVKVNPSQSGSRLRVRLYGTLNNTTYIDSIFVTRDSVTSGYADGDSQNWAWHGAPHASASSGPAI